MIQPTKQNAYILFLISAVLILKISPSWALILGIMHGLIFNEPLLLSQTTKTTSAKLLQLSIIFLGAHLNFSSLMTEGTKGFGVTLTSILLVLVIGHFIAQALKLDKNLSTLISVGTSICGGSAISAVSPVIKSNHQQMASSLGIIFILNTLAVFIFPWIGERLQLSQEQLAKALFPIGNLTKPEVREIAAQMDLITAEKKDSQGLCFIGKVRLPEFLQQKLQPKEGIIIQIDKNHPVYQHSLPEGLSLEERLAFEANKIKYTPEMGKVVGKHQGAHYFTIGQRKGLNVGGTTDPLFIIATDVTTNTIYTGLTSQHPGLFRKALFIANAELHWVRTDLALANGDSMEVMARIRYRQPLQKATLYQFESGIYVAFDEPQSAITEGQFVAWHIGDELIGSGVIS
jgi:tRNA U34 2-thiouridine synthase MnmA/TrmU